ncbi:MAG: SPOR domain-containing protein [Acidobacteriota bacterium]|nr:SPOR domain-containing protein [Acidobacteriota bacterium]
MTQTDGEKELVLGNKQLISLFFVAVALCGVFFAVGYMIGRNTSKSSTAATEIPSPPPVVAAAPAQESEPPRETTAPEVSPSPVNATPAASSPLPATSLSATAPPAAAQAPAKANTAPPAQTHPVSETPVAPIPGATYLQVTALRRSDADSLVRTLREQNFPALLADSSKPDLFRVLVGPFRQTADVAEAKARLKSLGFANAFVQK